MDDQNVQEHNYDKHFYITNNYAIANKQYDTEGDKSDNKIIFFVLKSTELNCVNKVEFSERRRTCDYDYHSNILHTSLSIALVNINSPYMMLLSGMNEMCRFYWNRTQRKIAIC